MSSPSNNTEFVTRIEAAWRASEALTTAILETALDAIVTIDSAGHILDFNPAAEKMFGYTREEALGREMAEIIIPPHLRERHRSGLARALATGQDTIVGRRIEITALRKSGEEFPVELAITRIHVKGAPMFTGHIRDITERRSAESALRESEQLLASITHNIADGIYRRMASGELSFVNEPFLKMTGYGSLEELRHVTGEKHYVQPRRRAELLALLERDGRFAHEEVEFVRKDGSTFWGLVSGNAVRDSASGRILYSDGAITDITERKQAELRRGAQLAVTRVLAEASTLAEAAPKILRAVCESLGWDVGAIWECGVRNAEYGMRSDTPQLAVPNSALEDELYCVDVWHAGEMRNTECGARSDRANSALAIPNSAFGEGLGEFEKATRERLFDRGVGLPGRIWATRQPQWIPDVAQDPNFPRAALAERVGLRSAFAFPIRLGDHVLGVIEFFSREIRQPDADVLQMFSAIGGQVGQFIERKRAEAALRQLNADLERRVAEATRGLRESQERFSKAFSASPVFISIARMSDGTFVEVNEAFLQSGGWTREEVIGRTSAELGIWADLEDRAKFLLEVQRRGFIRNREVALRSRDGRLDTVLLSAERIEIDSQPCVLAVGLNITARKRAEEDMQRALDQEKELSRLKTNFVTLVSHEFRTPLGIIMSAADILKKYFDRLTPGRRGEHLQDIHDASRRMAELMDEVLLLARVEADRMECKPAALDLRAFCQRLADETGAATANVCSIEFTARKLAGAPAADEALLRHIFTNLLSNAVKYSAPGSTVRFKIERHDDDAVFTVRDCGIGVPSQEVAELFQAFRRGSNVGERPGSGLGLVIVKRCVELHGGAIEIKSKESHGTTVTVRLPLFRATTVARKNPQKTEAKRPSAKEKRPSRRPRPSAARKLQS